MFVFSLACADHASCQRGPVKYLFLYLFIYLFIFACLIGCLGFMAYQPLNVI